MSMGNRIGKPITNITGKGSKKRLALQSSFALCVGSGIPLAHIHAGIREKREKAMPETNKTEEVFLLAYSPLLHDYALSQLVDVLRNTVTTIEGESCMLRDIRIDEA